MTEKKSQEKKEKENNYNLYIFETSATRLAGFTGTDFQDMANVM